jgi:predicted glycogen debranching enzyme
VGLHIIHSFNEKKVDEHINREAGFLITNKKGNYLSLGQDNITHMQGLFFFDHDQWELYKTVEDIKISKEMTAIKNNFFNVQRHYKDGAEENFNLFNNSMVYSVNNYVGELILELDFRPMFDFDDKGRIYTITKEDDVIIIKYDKFTDHSLSGIDKTRFLTIKGATNYKQIGEWAKKNYSYDEQRKSQQEFYIYKALSMVVNGHAELVFSFSDDKEKAKEHAEQVYENTHYLLHSFHKYVTHTFTSHDLALNAAMKALDDLLISTEHKERSVGIIAGLPWFYQFWARDELISLKALMLQEKHYLVKSILFKYLNLIADDGLIPSRFPGNPGDVKSIDSVGWVFFRLKEYIALLEEKKLVGEYLPETELMIIKRALEKAINGITQYHTRKGFIFNNEQETWMDTKPANRRGACIEVQALFLAMLNLHNHLASLLKSKQLFRGLEREYKEKVKREFFNGEKLYDSIAEQGAEYVPVDAIRPNVFLAYYIYPELLAKKEWKSVFDITLKALWLGWGGLTTVNYTSPLFRSEYTGMDDASYHNGDSWYYINNYAALAMHRLDKEYYAKQVSRIAHASKEEMFFSGFIGCCAEISSAKQMKSEGCLSQAWSAASLIELLHEMHR